MEDKHHLKITRYCPKEEIFDGMMTFREARKYMDENATSDRRVGFEVYNDELNRWEKSVSIYLGGRKVLVKGQLYIIDPDYRDMWKPENCGWYVWEVSQDRRFIISLGTKEEAEEVRARYQKWYDFERYPRQYIVEKSDVIFDSYEVHDCN